MIERMPTREYMAKEGMGFKLLKRAPYGSRFDWSRHPSFFLSDHRGGESRLGRWGMTGGAPTVRDWFQTPVREWL